MKVIRGFQVINTDGKKRIAVTYNETDDFGKIISENKKESFYTMDPTVEYNLQEVENFIMRAIG